MAALRNAGLLVGVTCWAPERATARARAAVGCLRHLIEQTQNGTDGQWDVVVIDNDVEHLELRRVLADVAGLRGVQVLRVSPQRGWAGARNAQLEFFMNGSWSHIAMCDQDVAVDDALWLRDVECAGQLDELDAFMLISAREDMQGVVSLKSGRLAWISREFLGGVHVVSRRSVEMIGGYNTTDFPYHWGFHDCEYGLRLKAAGLLEPSHGHYVDPIMRVVRHIDSTDEDPEHAAMKQRIVGEYFPVFQRRVVEIQLGQALFHSTRLPDLELRNGGPQ